MVDPDGTLGRTDRPATPKGDRGSPSEAPLPRASQRRVRHLGERLRARWRPRACGPRHRRDGGLPRSDRRRNPGSGPARRDGDRERHPSQCPRGRGPTSADHRRRPARLRTGAVHARARGGSDGRSVVVLAAALLLTRLLTRDVAVTSKIAVEPACAKQWSDEMLENGRVATEPAGAPRQTYEGFKFNTSDRTSSSPDCSSRSHRTA